MHTTAAVAKRLRRSVRTVNHVAAETEIGTLITGRMRLFSDADLAKLAEIFANRRPGRPSEKS